MRLFSPESMPVGLFCRESIPQLPFLIITYIKMWAKGSLPIELFSREVFFGNMYVPYTEILNASIDDNNYTCIIEPNEFSVVL